MECSAVNHCLRHLSVTVTRGLILILVFPLASAFVFNISPESSLVLIAATLVIEYGAAAVGVGLGLPPLYVLFVIICIALAVILTLFDIFELLGAHSERVSRFLQKSAERAGRLRFLKKYGIYGLVPGVITLGFYVCPPVSWVLGWPRERAVPLIMAGYIAISIVTILATIGILTLVPG
jgi:hypothetical protein